MHACVQVMASQKQMEAKYKQAQATAVSWLRGTAWCSSS
jgi:phage shock protein A